MTTLPAVAEKPVSTTTLKQTIEQNWQNRKVQVISSGAATSALAAGVAVATVLGGPLVAIASLAAATFVALGMLVSSLVVTKKQVTVDQPPISRLTTTPVMLSSPAPAVVAPAAARATAAPMKSPLKTAPKANTAPVVVTPTTVKPTLSQRIRTAFSTVGNYVTSHPFKTALGAAAVFSAGYGAMSAYQAYRAPAPVAGLLTAGPRPSSTPSSKPVFGPENAPVFGPKNAPVFGPKNAPVFGPENAPVFGSNTDSKTFIEKAKESVGQFGESAAKLGHKIASTKTGTCFRNGYNVLNDVLKWTNSKVGAGLSTISAHTTNPLLDLVVEDAKGLLGKDGVDNVAASAKSVYESAKSVYKENEFVKTAVDTTSDIAGAIYENASTHPAALLLAQSAGFVRRSEARVVRVAATVFSTLLFPLTSAARQVGKIFR